MKAYHVQTVNAGEDIGRVAWHRLAGAPVLRKGMRACFINRADIRLMTGPDECK